MHALAYVIFAGAVILIIASFIMALKSKPYQIIPACLGLMMFCLSFIVYVIADIGLYLQN